MRLSASNWWDGRGCEKQSLKWPPTILLSGTQTLVWIGLTSKKIKYGRMRGHLWHEVIKRLGLLFWEVSHSRLDHSPDGSQIPVRQLCREATMRRGWDMKTSNHMGDLRRGSPHPPALPYSWVSTWNHSVPGTLTATSRQIFCQRHSPKLYLQHWPTETVR